MFSKGDHVNVTLLIFCPYQVTFSGQKALELLLESYGFFPTLQTLVQAQSLLKLKERTPLPVTKSINSYILQEGSRNCRNDESNSKDISAKVAKHYINSQRCMYICLRLFVCLFVCLFVYMQLCLHLNLSNNMTSFAQLFL